MKKMLAYFLAGILALTITACGSAGGIQLDMGTGVDSGVYVSYGQVLSQVLQEQAGIQVTPHPTEGSKANMTALRAGDFQLALVQSDVMTYAWQGRRSFEQEGRMDSFRAVAGLYTEAVQLITVDPEIQEVEDLKGKRVSVGSPGSGVFFSAFDVLDAASITMNDIIPLYQDFAESTKALKSREIDAAFIVSGTPTPAVTELCRQDAAFLVPINQLIQKRLLDANPFYTSCVIPAGSYAGQAEAVETVGVVATLVASADTPAGDIYDILDTIFENRQTIASLHGKGAELSLETAADISTVPLHGGAVRYYQDQGLDVK